MNRINDRFIYDISFEKEAHDACVSATAQAKAFVARHEGEGEALIIIDEALDIAEDYAETLAKIRRRQVKAYPVGTLRNLVQENLDDVERELRRYRRARRSLKQGTLQETTAQKICNEVFILAKVGDSVAQHSAEAIKINEGASDLQRWTTKALIDVRDLPSDVARIATGAFNEVKSFFSKLF